jgi:transcriptional regulator with XRE-family HTH domain
MNFSGRLRFAIKQSGLRIKELAALADVNPRTIENWLEAKPCLPRVDLAVRVARALNTTVEFLVCGSSNEQPHKKAIPQDAATSVCTCFHKYDKFIQHLKALNKQELDILQELIIINSSAFSLEPENLSNNFAFGDTKESRHDVGERRN